MNISPAAGNTGSRHNFSRSKPARRVRPLHPLRQGICILCAIGVASVPSPAQTGGPCFAILPDIPIGTGVAIPNANTTEPGRPAVGFDGTNYLVVSCRFAGGDPGLFGVLVSPQGVIITRFRITASSADFSNPSVAFDGTSYLVVFQRDKLIFGVRVSPSGEVMDTDNGFLISAGIADPGSNFAPDVAFDGQNYLVVWNKFTASNYEIFGARVTPSGQALGEFPVFSAPGEQVFPSITFGAGNFFVVWRDTRSGTGPSPDSDIFGARVSPQGTILDAAGIAICTAPNLQAEPHLAFDGQNYFVVWLDGRHHDPAWYARDIYGARIAPNGALLDGAPGVGGIEIYASSAQYQSDPRVCFDGRDFFVTWWIYAFSPPSGTFAARVSTSGVVLDGPAGGLAVQLRIPDCFACHPVHPNPISNGRTVLVAWVNNSELDGTSKDVLANLVVPMPRITGLDVASAGSADVRIRFESRRNLGYRVEASSNLGTWQMPGPSVAGTGGILEVQLPGAGAPERNFFRVRVEF